LAAVDSAGSHSAYLFFVGLIGKLKPATIGDWLRGMSVSLALYAVLWFLAPAIYNQSPKIQTIQSRGTATATRCPR
jgi:hypothetical protein